MQNKETKLISCQPIIARVVEELRTFYFAGSSDELMMNIWVKDCIDKFEYTYLPIKEAVLTPTDKVVHIHTRLTF